MTNLSQKFDELQDQLSTQHAEMMQKMNALISALSAPAPYPNIGTILNQMNGKLQTLIEFLAQVNMKVGDTLDHILSIDANLQSTMYYTQMIPDIYFTVLGLNSDLIVNKLDLILAALGAPIPTTTTTLDDVITVLSNIKNGTDLLINIKYGTDMIEDVRRNTNILENIRDNTYHTELKLGDIHLDTMSIDQKLLLMRGYLADMNLNLAAIQEDHLNNMAQQLSDIISFQTVSIDSLNALKFNVGLPTGGAETTVLGYLSAIRNCTCSVAKYFVPQEPGTVACDEPFTSVGSSFEWLPNLDQNAREDFAVVAVFQPPYPNGIADLTQPPGQDRVLHPTTSWEGWGIYVKSSARAYTADTRGSSVYTTNTWRAMSGSAPLCVSVQQGETIEVSLCAPHTTQPPSTDCITASSQIITWTGQNEPAVPAAVWPNNATNKMPTKTNVFASQSIYLQGDYHNWTIQISMWGINLYTFTSTGWSRRSINSNNNLLITETTTYVAFINNSSSAQFTVQLCPPALPA